MIDELPTELLTISGNDYNDLVRGVETIRNSVAFWQQNASRDIGIADIDGKNVLQILRHVLTKCPDQSPSHATVELGFITDDVFRDNIRLDISTATSALHNGEWKAATVLAGAAAEALLLWAITNAPGLSNLVQKPKGAPEDWYLREYITVAKSLDLIKNNTEQLANLAMNFRNLIHPGRAQRLREICDRATALTALAAVECIVRDLN
ncbi:hypothetical protein [Acidocella aquatica]|uniref:hypothetical protein n=1 Tax=Acidocella aquatica TaxID=1922313 RepID=UPI0024E17A41|nr:hypothetical protein [Acidocella aquatica]